MSVRLPGRLLPAVRGAATILSVVLPGACAATHAEPDADEPSPYLLLFAGDGDAMHDDFFAIIDVRPESDTRGRVVATLPVGMRSSLPHHMEYELPPPGELLFANAHHHEATLLLDISDPLQPAIVRTLQPPAPLRFGHDFARLPNGNRILGFLRSEGPSPAAGDELVPGGHGGIAEYTSQGELVRMASAAVDGYDEPIRTYAIVPMPDIDRIVTTSAPMMEDHVADVVQVWRYSDFTLLHTLRVPPGHARDGSPLPEAARYPFGPRPMPDGSILLNSYGCAFARLTGIDTAEPRLENVHTIHAPAGRGDAGACSIPVVVGHYWVMPVGHTQQVVVLDVSNPARPIEVSRLETPPDFNPHWLARDPASRRLVLGAELGGEQGMYVLLFDPDTGVLEFDASVGSPGGRAGYIDLERQDWPHGPSGPAWAHAALFLPARR